MLSLSDLILSDFYLHNTSSFNGNNDEKIYIGNYICHI